jgi:hypothetical protein
MPESARDIWNITNMPVPTPAAIRCPEPRGRHHFGSGPTTIQRYNQARRIFVTADLPPGVIKSQAMDKVNKLPIMKSCRPGVSNTAYGGDKWQQEMMSTSSGLAAGSCWSSRCWCCSITVVSPLVNMGSLFLAPLGACSRCC